MTDHAPANPARLTAPLSEAEFDELDDFLESDAVPDACMSMEMVDGLICALAVGPKLVPPSRWLPVIWGGTEGPTFESEAQASRIIELLTRHWNTTQSRVKNPVAADSDFFVPTLTFPDDELPDDTLDTEYGKEWAQGFMTGAGLEPDSWEDAFQDEECASAFGLIMILDLGQNPDRPDIVVDLGKRRQLILSISQVANTLYQFWKNHKPRRAPAASPAVSYRPPAKAGRNDPCPCGSGRKFKKCCGAPANMH